MANTAKQNILNRIKKALVNPVPLPFSNRTQNEDIFVQTETNLVSLFEKEFKSIQGNYIYCKNNEELKHQLMSLIDSKNWKKIFYKKPFFDGLDIEQYNDLPTCDVSITDCESLVARTGSIILSSAQASGRTTSVYAPVHVCIAYTSQIVYDVKDSLVLLNNKYGDNFPSFVTVASGPSRTADIEKTLVTGVHGPKEVFCFLVEG